MGSKSRIAKHIVPIIQKFIDDNNIKTYIEPFCGGCNVIDKIKCDTKYAIDKQSYLIALMQNLDKLDSLPEMITKDHYTQVKTSYQNQDYKYEMWYVGAVGFLTSYNGKFFSGGYAGAAKTKIGTIRNYYDEARRNLLKQSPNLRAIQFKCADYQSLEVERTLIYCDPPYEGTEKYDVSKDFSHDNFWNWCRKMSEGNIVLISEQSAPVDFECIWQQEVKRTMDNNSRGKAIEQLFIMKGRGKLFE
jgi:DNA adenine methylase